MSFKLRGASGTHLGRFWDASGAPLGQFWDISGALLGRLWDGSRTFGAGRFWDASGTCLGRFWDASGTRLKQPFVACRKGDRLDENTGFSKDGAQQLCTDINPMKVRNLTELSKYIGPGAISYKSDIPMYL